MDSDSEVTPGEDKELRRDALGLLYAQIQAHERYHTQKENMTWLVTVAYVGGAALLLGRRPFWECWQIHEFLLWFILLVVTAIVVSVFIGWQFKNRNKANAFFNCCNDAAVQWLHSGIGKDDLRPEPLCELNHMLVPHAVAKRFREYRFSFPQILTGILVLLWTVGAGAYVMLTYRWPC